VAPRTEHHDGRTYIAQIDRYAVRRSNTSGGELVADEQLIDDRLYLGSIQNRVAAPPLFEPEITWGLGIDLGIEVVLLGPQRVRRVLVLEILHQPGAIEFAGAQIAHQCGEPAAAK